MTLPAGSDVEAALVWAAARGGAEAWRHLLEANAPRVAAYVR